MNHDDFTEDDLELIDGLYIKLCRQQLVDPEPDADWRDRGLFMARYLAERINDERIVLDWRPDGARSPGMDH